MKIAEILKQYEKKHGINKDELRKIANNKSNKKSRLKKLFEK